MCTSRRDAKLERHAAAVVALGPDAAVMRLDDGSADGQSHSHAPRLGREERVEKMLFRRVVQPGAAVPDLEVDGAILAHEGTERQRAPGPLHGVHRLNRIHDEIYQDLLQLDAV